TGFVDVRDVTDAMIALTNSEASNERFVVSSENMGYQQFLTKVATAYQTTPPRLKAGKFIIGVGWRLERLRYVLTRKEPRITKETARSSQNRSFFSSDKLKNHLQWKFIPIDQSVKETVAFFIQNKTVV
ncbi:MAG: nucleoside-diphosphate sugar epimerase, partial [Marinilabiliaceae bacterium]|nr:nucleoside-diphosphate sugar epimerase [Marinilabiliaceae bacterium]